MAAKITDTSSFVSLGQNVKCHMEGDILFLAIDTKAEGTRSASGKTVVKATTRGNQSVPGLEKLGAKIGVNMYVPAPTA